MALNFLKIEALRRKAFLFLVMLLMGMGTTGRAIAQSTTSEMGRIFVWEPVPDAWGSSDLGNPDAPLEPWYLNQDFILRRGDVVTFETVSPDAQYVQFLGNCRTWQITPKYVGEFLDENSIRYQFSPLDWQYATEWRSALLTAACSCIH